MVDIPSPTFSKRLGRITFSTEKTIYVAMISDDLRVCDIHHKLIYRDSLQWVDNIQTLEGIKVKTAHEMCSNLLKKKNIVYSEENECMQNIMDSINKNPFQC